jgi:predicted RNase H-like HicB family nuclease
MTYHLPLELTYESGVWLARSGAIQGLLVTGDTLDKLFDELPLVVQALFEACQEKGWTFVQESPNARPSDIVWVAEFPHTLIAQIRGK